MAISVIVSNFNGAKYLPKLLATLHAQQGVEIEIIVVDRNSHDASHEILAADPSVKVVQEPPESGLVSGYAVGAKHARHEHLFFSNEDMWFEPDLLKRLEERIDLSQRIAAADPWQWTYDGQLWIHGGVRFAKARWCLTSPYPFRRPLFTVDLPAGTRIPYPCAGAFLIHRQVYEALGGWDTRFFLDHEDVDFFLRAWQAGWHSVTVPEAKVYHAVGASNAQEYLATRRPVSQRRYVSGRASIPIIGLKTFSAAGLLWPVLQWKLPALAHLFGLRWKRFAWDLEALRQIFSRWGAAWRHRREQADVLRERPGQQFFCEKEFNE